MATVFGRRCRPPAEEGFADAYRPRISDLRHAAVDEQLDPFARVSRVDPAVDIERRPVMNEASGPARNATAAAISSGLAIPAQRDLGFEHRGEVGVVGIHVGIGRTRVDDIDRDAFRTEVARPALSYSSTSAAFVAE